MQHHDGIGTAHHMEPLQERAQEMLSLARRRLEPIDGWVRAQVQERPLVALAGALGVGYLLGRLIRRI